MDDMYDRIDDLLYINGVSKALLERELGINPKTLSTALRRRNKGLSHKYVGAIARYFEVTTDWLIYGPDDRIETEEDVKKVESSNDCCKYGEYESSCAEYCPLRQSKESMEEINHA